MYGLTPDDLELQARARGFADELIPHEEYAEAHDGELPDEVAHRLEARARVELGLTATNMPDRGRRPRLHARSSRSWSRSRAAGSPTRSPGAWPRRPAWWPAVANDHQRETWLLPTVRGRREECYAITEEYAGSDVSDLQATARRDGDEYVLNGVKWHVTSFNKADYVFFQAVLTTGRARRRAGAVRRRQGHARASASSARRRTPTPSPTTTRSWRSRTCASRRRHLVGVGGATGCPSSTSGSASSG